MKKTTKLALWVGAAAGGVWAWFKFRPDTLAMIRAVELSRKPPPGYASATNVFDANGRPGVRYLYPAGVTIGGRLVMGPRAFAFFVPNDGSRGVWSPA